MSIEIDMIMPRLIPHDGESHIGIDIAPGLLHAITDICLRCVAIIRALIVDHYSIINDLTVRIVHDLSIMPSWCQLVSWYGRHIVFLIGTIRIIITTPKNVITMTAATKKEREHPQQEQQKQQSQQPLQAAKTTEPYPETTPPGNAVIASRKIQIAVYYTSKRIRTPATEHITLISQHRRDHVGRNG